MSSALVFDSLAYVKRLKEAGFTEHQAEVQAEALVELVDERLAAKRDIKELELRLVAELSGKMMETKSEIIKWVAGLLIAQAALTVTLLKVLA
jgi:hypothetical protein